MALFIARNPKESNLLESARKKKAPMDFEKQLAEDLCKNWSCVFEFGPKALAKIWSSSLELPGFSEV